MKKIKIANVPREHDDRVLSYLAMRSSGMSCNAIAAKLGAKVPTVNETTNRVLGADLAESGEPAGSVRGAYW